MNAFSEWESFYVIVGSSAGALIGLQFVVLTLLAERLRPRMAEASGAFTSPTMVHFAAVLLLSAIMSAPWGSHNIVSVLWGLMSLTGIGSTLVVVRRMRTQHAYKPVLEDWLTHGLLPLGAYLLLAAASFQAHAHPHAVDYAVAGVTLLLLFASIHNAWDAASYHVMSQPKSHPKVAAGTKNATECTCRMVGEFVGINAGSAPWRIGRGWVKLET